MAILWVFNCHYGIIANYKFFDCILDITKLNPIKNGDMGVDIFFVLSGFLIADILIREIERDKEIDTFHFLRSRFLRIWPALLVEFSLSLAFGETLKNGLLMLLFVGNFFGIESHLWSVCVEF
jgi:peptidoglycan/LPS O-acetylase OafA/YrhL